MKLRCGGDKKISLPLHFVLRLTQKCQQPAAYSQRSQAGAWERVRKLIRQGIADIKKCLAEISIKDNFYVMKAIKSWAIALTIILSLTISGDKVFAARIIISATSGIFSPNTVYASVGDTIIWWTYANSHTTTCIGTDGCSVLPAGAQP